MTRNRALLTLLLLLPLWVCSQQKGPVQSPTFGVHFFYNDFKTPAAIKSTSLSSVLRNKEFARLKDMSPGIALNYLHGFSPRFDISGMVAGSFPDYPRQDGSLFGQKNLLLEADISVRGKMFPGNYWVSPYLQLGAGFSKYKNHWGVYIPAGVGLQVNLPGEFFVLVNAQYRAAVTDKTVSPHLFYSIGIAGAIRKKPKRAPQPVPIAVVATVPVTDRDGDGILDMADDCPDQPGMAMFKGCPDNDRDSVPDFRDQCPAVFGLVRLEGCPTTDTVKVEVEVEVDVGQKIAYAAEHIFFATSRYEVLPESFIFLDTVVAIMKRDLSLKLVIEGHTDNVGDSVKNKMLSKRRAQAVFDYIVGKEVASGRVSAAGYGEERPRAENGTDEGRRRNRRVEMRLRIE